MGGDVAHSFGTIRGLYAQRGFEARYKTDIKPRLKPELLAVDYGVLQDVAADLHDITGFGHSDAFRQFRSALNVERTHAHMAEVTRLHERFLADDGFVLPEGRQFETFLAALMQRRRLIEGAAVMQSKYFGEIDLARLNLGMEQGILAFEGGEGQIAFIAALAVVTGKFDWNLSKLPEALSWAKGDRKQAGWKAITVDWRRAAVINAMKDNIIHSDLTGYRQFAREWADGDMKKAYMIASSVLNGAFPSKRWGKAIQLRENEIDEFCSCFRTGLEGGLLVEHQGFARFLNMLPAHIKPFAAIASADALFGSKIIADLNWPTKKECSRKNKRALWQRLL